MSSPPFDLDRAIAAWLRPYRHRRVFLREDLNELERHLRDHIAHLRSEGLADDEAFRQAVRAVGASWEAEDEYRKVYWGKLRRQRRRLDELFWTLAMLKNYLKIALRHLKRQPMYTGINVLGLAVGIAACVLIGLYVRDELTYDRFHTEADRIYRLRLAGNFQSYNLILDPSPDLAATLLETTSTVDKAVRLHVPGRVVVETESHNVYEDGLLFTDSTLLEIFDFPLVQGNPAVALTRPDAVVITPDIARKYFGEHNAVGQTLRLFLPSQSNPGARQAHAFEVTGIIAPPPSNSTLQFQMLASLTTLEAVDAAEGEALPHSVVTYLLLQNRAAVPDLKEHIDGLMANHPLGAMEGRLNPFTSLHLRDMTTQQDTPFSGKKQYVYLFSIVALLILLVGCVNFTNLATARSLRRAREVGVRKVVGAQRGQLIRQFLGEALLLTLFAIVIALLLVELTLPAFNAMVGKQLDASYFDQHTVLPWLVALFLIVGGLAGGYPAFVLARFRPSAILKGSNAPSVGSVRLRQALVVFQFTISIALMASVLVIRAQLQFMQAKDLGLNPNQVIALEPQDQIGSNYEAFKQEALKLPGVTHVTFASLPGGIGMQATPEGSEEQQVISTQLVDPDFVATMGIRVVAGQDLGAMPPAEASGAVLINETAARDFGWIEPLGKTMYLDGDTPHRVAGVVADFHEYSLRREIHPLMVRLGERPQFQSVLIRLQAEHLPTTLDDVRHLWTQFAPAYPFEYTFLDEQFADYYRTEQRLGHLFGLCSVLAVLIACLGLFGLAAYAAETRIKEIGIRKVLGATVSQIVTLLSKDLLTLVAIAFVLATPLAYFAMHKWLEDFAYHIDPSPWLFAVAGLAALGIAMLTTSYQAIKAALADPVNSLRHE